MSLFSLIDTSQGLNQTQVDARIDLLATEKMDNIVIVKQESDFGVAVGNQITLTDGICYQIAVKELFLSKELVIPNRSLISILGAGGFNQTIIYFTTTSKKLFNCANLNNLSLWGLRIIDATGTNTLFDLTGHPSLSLESEPTLNHCSFVNFYKVGIFKNITITTNANVHFFQCGSLTLDNVYAFSAFNFLFQNFYPTNQEQLIIKTNLNQASIIASAFVPTKNQSPINIDPAIVSTSGLGIGTNVPYQGYVFGSIVKFEDLGGGIVKVYTNVGHSFDNGDNVYIQYTANYNGVFAVSNVVKVQADATYGSVGTFNITTTFVANDAQGLAVLLSGANPLVVPFFKQGTIATITSVSNSGGLALFTTSGTAPITGTSLYISGTTNYDQGGYAINVSSTTFTLLNSLGQPVSFIASETPINATFNTGSLDQTNNVVSVNSAGGIIPDSQALGNNILTTTVVFSNTTTLTRVSTGTWLSTRTERFRATDDGRLVYSGKTTATVSISCKVVCIKPSGTTATAFANIMVKRSGTASFVVIPNYPSAQFQVQTANASQLTISAIIDNVSTGDEIGVGIAGDSAYTLNILSIDYSVKK